MKNMEFNVIDKMKGALTGLACGDAIGTTVEFKSRGSFQPLTDMIGGGPFGLEKGQWTDDTSMALCLAMSLIERKRFDASDQMNRYCNWYNYGYMSSTGQCFDIGMTVSAALNKYIVSKDPFSGSIEASSSGNGSIMRLAPIPIFYQSNPKLAFHYSGESSRTTHGSLECIACCQYMTSIILDLFNGSTKEELKTGDSHHFSSEKVMSIVRHEYLNKSYEELTGSGYVIESLESALWCFFNSNSFEEAVLLSANIGNDADTTAAVCGQIAGAYYGQSGIPKKWKEALFMSDEIDNIAQQLYEIGRCH